MICLDTNAVIAVLRGQQRLVERFSRQVLREPLGLSTVALYELRYGIAKSDRPQRNAQRLEVFLQLPIVVLPFQAEDAEDAGDIRATLELAGTPIGAYDVLIAAQARCRDAVLVTANVREFGQVPRLKVEDWSAR